MRQLQNCPENCRSHHTTPHNVQLRTLCGAPYNAEIGAAWSKCSNERRDYLSVKLDHPCFTTPIYANLFDDERQDLQPDLVAWAQVGR